MVTTTTNIRESSHDSGDTGESEHRARVNMGSLMYYPPTYDPGEDECDEEVEVRHAAELLHQVQGEEGVQAVLGRLEPEHKPVSRYSVNI